MIWIYIITLNQMPGMPLFSVKFFIIFLNFVHFRVISSSYWINIILCLLFIIFRVQIFIYWWYHILFSEFFRNIVHPYQILLNVLSLFIKALCISLSNTELILYPSHPLKHCLKWKILPVSGVLKFTFYFFEKFKF